MRDNLSPEIESPDAGRPLKAGPAPAIAFDRVSKRFRNGVEALHDVRLTVAQGTRTALLGPNGAGKSTAVRLVQGALSPTAGRVTVLGQTADSDGYAEVRRRVGIVPQAAGPYRDLSAGEYLDLARQLYGRGDVSREAGRFGLAAHLGKMMSELSGGLQRRLMLAAALLADPEVLLLDEPGLGLDPVATEEIRRLLSEIAVDRTMLLCTNNLEEAAATCDHVVILDRGKVVWQDSLDNVAGEPRIALRALQPEDLRNFLAARGLTSTSDAEGRLVVRLSGGDEAIPLFLREALDAGIGITECTRVTLDLKSVFFEVVERS